jgi:general secretion pathway protein A
MYEAFFKLDEKPFALTPSHRFLYLSEGHKEAFALMKYGVVERKGFIMLTGDVGTGKTTIIQALLQSIGTDVECIHFSNPLLTPGEFIDYLASSTFKRRLHFKSKADFLYEFEAYLKKAQQHQRAFILIIDEAQTLSYEVLEELRLLSNLESAEEKLINIFLVGQPELIERLRDPRARAVYQRIASRFHLQPLTLDETGRYVTKRLRVAGSSNPERIFTKQAIRTLHDRSGGIPRTINVLADNALLLGYSLNKAKITQEMIEESYRDMHLGEEETDRPQTAREAAPQPSPEPQQATEPQDASEPLTVAAKPPRVRRGFRWAFAGAALLALMIHFSGVSLVELFDARERLSAEARLVPSWLDAQPEDRVPPPTPPAAPEPARAPGGEASAPAPEPATLEASRKPSQGVSRVAATGGSGEAVQVAVADTSPRRPSLPDVLQQGEVDEALPGGGERAVSEVEGTRIVVEPGDYLAKLAMEVYGRADGAIFALLQKHNPTLTNIHQIEVGQAILFPALSTTDRREIYTVHVASYYPDQSAQRAFQALLSSGYEAFIVPFYSPRKGILYRVTVGKFQSEREARAYASELVEKEAFTYTNVLNLKVNEAGS